jgi:hypothetical protein
MPGVVSTLKPNDHICIFSQQINNFTLAFVSPLGSDDDYISHNAISFAISHRPTQTDTDKAKYKTN